MNMLRPEDVESFPYKNVIVRAVGLHERVGVDISFATLRAGDQILLCSDGLSDLVRNVEIERAMNDAASIDQAADDLIAAPRPTATRGLRRSCGCRRSRRRRRRPQRRRRRRRGQHPWHRRRRGRRP